MKKRIIPKIRFINYHKQFPTSTGAFKRLFYINTRWGGDIINIGILHYAVSLDFRKNWLDDMLTDEIWKNQNGKKNILKE